MPSDSVLANKSFDFAVKVVAVSRELQKGSEYVLSRQLIKSGTSIGANVREAAYAQSKADFVTKLTIALKEANETLYWLELLEATNLLQPSVSQPLKSEARALLALLIASVKTAKK